MTHRRFCLKAVEGSQPPLTEVKQGFGKAQVSAPKTQQKPCRGQVGTTVPTLVSAPKTGTKTPS